MSQENPITNQPEPRQLEQTEALELAERLRSQRFTIEDFLDLEIADKDDKPELVSEVLRPLQEFFLRNEGKKGADLDKTIQEIFAKTGHHFPSGNKNWALDETLESLPQEFFVPSKKSWDTMSEKEREITQATQTHLGQYWSTTAKIKHFFMEAVEFMSSRKLNSMTLASRCPRSLNFRHGVDLIDDLKINPSDADAILAETMKYQSLFLEQGHKVNRLIADENKKPKCDLEAIEQSQRIQYSLGQIASMLSIKVGKFFKHDKKRRQTATPSLEAFANIPNDEEGKALAKEYIETRLLQILSRDQAGNLIAVQEDFILGDISALAITFGLTEFEPLFKGLKLLRQILHILEYDLVQTKHINPRKSILKTISSFIEKRLQLPKIAVLGNGNMLLEKFLQKQGAMESCSGVDVLLDKPSDYSHTEIFGNIRSTRQGISDLLQETDKGIIESPEVRDRVIKHLDEADIIVATNVWHEIVGNHFAYTRDLLDKILRHGGTMYITDPVYSEAIDRETPESLATFDSTLNPRYMRSLESFFDLITFAMKKGVFIKYVYNHISGCNDFLQRITIQLRKPRKGQSFSYETPRPIDELEKDSPVSLEETFSLWPLTQLTADQKGMLKSILGDRSFSFKEFPLPPLEGLREITMRLYTKLLSSQGVGTDNFDSIIERNSPDPSIAKILKKANITDESLNKANTFRGMIYLLQNLLKHYLDVDLPLGNNWPTAPIHFSEENLDPQDY